MAIRIANRKGTESGTGKSAAESHFDMHEAIGAYGYSKDSAELKEIVSKVLDRDDALFLAAKPAKAAVAEPEPYIQETAAEVTADQPGLAPEEPAEPEAADPTIRINPLELAVSGVAKGLKRARAASAGLRSAGNKASDFYLKSQIRATAAIRSGLDAITAPEHQKARKVTAIAIGAVALGTTAYLTYRGLAPSGSSHAHEALPAAPKAPSHPLEAIPSPAPAKSQPEHAHKVIKHTAKLVETIKYRKEHLAYNGDTIWNHVRLDLKSKLGRDPSDSLVRKVTGQVLRDNRLNWQDAKHLRVGQNFKIRS